MRTADQRVTRRAAGAARGVAALAVLAALALVPSAAAATEAQQGAQTLSRLQAGTVTCASLKTDDFDRIGEYVMEQMLGSSSAHEAMNRQMSSMMGSAGEKQAHVYMGRRFAGCATGRAPSAFGAMMGMMGAGMMGSASGAGYGYGMMSGSGRGDGYGGMMGDGRRTGDDDWDAADTAMAIFMGLFVLVALVGLALWRPWRRQTSGTPLEILQRRFARGEIDQEEFDRRRSALGGPS